MQILKIEVMILDFSALQIVHYPAKVLREPAKPITQINDEVATVARRMLELMHQAPGVGLAAPQIGLSWRLFVANATGEPEDDCVYINPVLSQPGRQTADREEGCLSLPGITGIIRRPQAITITALDIQGRSFTQTADDLWARIWQHENDHLDGRLIIDLMAPIDRLANERLIRDMERVASLK